MKTSKQGLEFIMKHEGFRNHPYLCPSGIPTIGYGNTYYADGTKVSLDDQPITLKQGKELFALIIKKFEKQVNDVLSVTVSQNQFDALVSFCYNVGIVNLQRSTLLKYINSGESIERIQREFLRWNKGRVNGKLTIMNGLTRRRKQEAYLYGLA